MITSIRSYAIVIISIASIATLFFLFSSSSAQAATCSGNKEWRYIDNDKDKLGNPSKKKRICRQFPKEGYIKNRKDKNDDIAQYEYRGLTRGWVKIFLRDNSSYKFRSFQTPKASKKKVKAVRFYKNGELRNSLITLHPRGKSIKFVRYYNGFAERTKKLTSKKWNKRYLALYDFDALHNPEVVVVLKKNDTVQTHVVNYVFRKGFTKKATLTLDGLDTVKVKNTVVSDTGIELRDETGTTLTTLAFDSDTFTLTQQ